MRVAIYARISTSDKKQDLDNQLLPLKEYVASRGWNLCEVYTDQISGSKESRPGLNKLIEDAHRRRFDCVLVWRFDRFARSTKQLILALDTFRSLGINFISYQESIDTTTPTGQLMFTLLASFAQFERSIIQERVRAGLDKARAKGKKLGRPKVLLDLDALAELKKLGLSLRQISKKLDIPKSTIGKYLKQIQ